MKVLLTYVSSVNGKITRGSDDDVFAWSSKEDKEHFHKVRDSARAIIRSSKTYEIVKGGTRAEGQLMVVMTRSPQNYRAEELSGVVEFTDMSPVEVVRSLEDRGYESVLIAAGGGLSSQFFRDGLIDEFHLTIEPLIFGTGVPMFAELDYVSNLELIEQERLNSKGTILLKYRVIK